MAQDQGPLQGQPLPPAEASNGQRQMRQAQPQGGADPQLSPREQELLTELEQIRQGCAQLAAALQSQSQRLSAQEQELSAARRSVIELKEENSHLRSVLQTWRERMDSVLSQLRSLE